MSSFQSTICAIVLSSIILVGCSSNTSLITNRYTIQGYNNDDIILITPTTKVGGFNAFYSSGGLTSEEYQKTLSSSGYTNCTVINGTYFGITSGEHFQPAGRLSLYNGLGNIETITSTIKPHEDINLGVHLTYKKTLNRLSINEDNTPIHGVGFFSGPMIIENGLINTKLSEDISHRNKQYKRTFIIQLADHSTVLGISKQKTTLSDLGEHLNTIFKGQIISVVNLDGGPSTAVQHEKIAVNTNTKLPLWFSICEKN